MLKKLKKLVLEIKDHPEYGSGKPEILKHDLAGIYSRRITKSHRLVYSINTDTKTVFILSVHSNYSP